jgi:DNA-binding NtrC family response regulator
MAATLLVVEDDDDVRDLAVNVLREAGYRVLPAMNGGIALVMLEQDLPIDVLFTDIVMPGDPDGFGLAEEAKKLRPGLKVLYATGFSGLSRAEGRARLYGTIMEKPYRPTRLLREIAGLLGGAPQETARAQGLSEQHSEG